MFNTQFKKSFVTLGLVAASFLALSAQAGVSTVTTVENAMQGSVTYTTNAVFFAKPSLPLAGRSNFVEPVPTNSPDKAYVFFKFRNQQCAVEMESGWTKPPATPYLNDTLVNGKSSLCRLVKTSPTSYVLVLSNN